jgi:hypothetical protein
VANTLETVDECFGIGRMESDDHAGVGDGMNRQLHSISGI